MQNTVKTSISISYRAMEGWHVFTSEDLPGLHVASKDLQVAYNDVGPSIEALLMLDEGVSCVVSPEVPMDEFLAAVKGHQPDHDDYVPSVRRFTVSGACA